MRALQWVAVAAGVFAALPADAAQRTPAILDTLAQCKAIGEPAARLACYDKASADFTTAVKNKDLVVLDRAAVRETRKGLFGFALPKLSFFGGDDNDKSAEFSEINTTVASARPIGYDKYQIVLPDGPVWRTTEALTLPPKPGTKLRIRKGAMGAYFLRFGSGPTVRGQRER